MVRLVTRAQARKWWPHPRKDANKGDMGRVYIVAGSNGMAGAAILTATGCARAGAGLTRLGIVKSQQNAAVKRLPLEVTTQALPEKNGQLSNAAVSVIEKALKTFGAQVVAIGPGLGQSAAVHKNVRKLVLKMRRAVVLDADGLNAFAGTGSLLSKHAGLLIITPHPGELGRLLGKTPRWIQQHRVEAAIMAAKRFRCVCLLKGAGTLVTDGKDVWKNTSGNSGMASGGMGDVLTGIIAALWARLPAIKAAALGAYVHGLSADLAYLASDVARLFPKAAAKI